MTINTIGVAMVKVSISVRYPEIKLIKPFRLIDAMSIDEKSRLLADITSVFKSIERWTNAERNYNT